MIFVWLLVAALTVPATWAAALTHAVRTVSRSSLTARLAGGPRSALANWFVDHVDDAHTALAIVRTVLRIAIVLAVVLAVSRNPTRVMEAALAQSQSAVDVDAPAPERPGLDPAPDAVPVLHGFLISVRGMLLACLASAVIVWFTTVAIASSIARSAGEPLVAWSLRSIHLLTMATAAVRPVIHVTDESVRRLAGAGRREVEAEAEAELLRSIEEQQRGGGLDPQSASMLENIVWFNQTDVGEVMTPRTDIDGLEYTDDLSEIRALIDEHGHSRMPVFEENLDHIVGILYVKDLVPYLGADATGFQLRPLLREPKFVPETKPVNELLQDFQRSEVHMAIVVDEYGGTAGIVTIEDVLEEIVGEIQDEHDTDHEDVPTLDEIEDGVVEVDGRYHLDDLNEAVGLNLPEDEEFDTVAGFVLALLGRVPDSGESVRTEEARITVVQATSTVIERLRVEFGARVRDEPEADDDVAAVDDGSRDHAPAADDEPDDAAPGAADADAAPEVNVDRPAGTSSPRRR
jgi:magnesium and cobalt transporter